MNKELQQPGYCNLHKRSYIGTCPICVTGVQLDPPASPPSPAIEGKEEDQKPEREPLYRFVYAGERQPKETGKRYGVIFWDGKYGEAVYHGGNHWIEAHFGTISPTELSWLEPIPTPPSPAIEGKEELDWLESFNREEVKNILMEFSYDFQQEKYGGCSTHRHIVSLFIKAHRELFSTPTPPSPAIEGKEEELPCICSQVGSYPGCTPGCTFPKCGLQPTPPAGAEGEREVPEEIHELVEQLWIKNGRTGSANGSFTNGASAMWRKMQEQAIAKNKKIFWLRERLRIIISNSEEFDRDYANCRQELSAARTTIAELEAKVKDLQDWIHSHQ